MNIKIMEFSKTVLVRFPPFVLDNVEKSQKKSYFRTILTTGT